MLGCLTELHQLKLDTSNMELAIVSIFFAIASAVFLVSLSTSSESNFLNVDSNNHFSWIDIKILSHMSKWVLVLSFSHILPNDISVLVQASDSHDIMLGIVNTYFSQNLILAHFRYQMHPTSQSLSILLGWGTIRPVELKSLQESVVIPLPPFDVF